MVAAAARGKGPVPLWPDRPGVAIGTGLVGAAALLAAELARRPEYLRTSTAFVASSPAVPVLLSLVVGMVVSIRLVPTDLALGRHVYLRLAGVTPERLVWQSLRRSCRDALVATAVFVTAGAAGAAVLLPAAPLDRDDAPWSFVNEAPLLAEVVIGTWMVAAACLVSGLAHLGAQLGLNRLVTGALAPLAPVLASVVLPDTVGRTVEEMVNPRYWAVRHPTGWWSVAGGGVLWAVAAVVAGGGAVLVARRSRR